MAAVKVSILNFFSLTGRNKLVIVAGGLLKLISIHINNYYDFFTYNLVQQIGAFDIEMEVFRNDKVSIEEIERKKPDHIIISPGPCTPKEAGISNDIVKYFSGKIPILGVCLGHQCIAYTYGADVVRARRLMHGKT